MTATFWWILVLVLGIIIGNLWLIRRSNTALKKKPQTEITQKKSTEGGITGSVVAGSGTDGSRIKQVDTDHHHSSSDGGSDGGGSSGD